MSYGILVQSFKIPSLVDKLRSIFWGKRSKRWNSPKKISPCIFLLYKFLLKSVNSLSGISCTRRYWFKALKCQIWLTNTKQFFWEREANLETIRNLSPYIWVFCKFVLKSVRSINWIQEAAEYWLKVLKCQISWTNTKPFFGESEGNNETLQKISHYLWVSYKFLLKSVNSLIQMLWATEYWL